MANLMGATYSLAKISVFSWAPKAIKRGRSKKATKNHITAANRTDPMTEAEKNSLDFRVSPSFCPRMVLKSTDPPMPISRPKL